MYRVISKDGKMAVAFSARLENVDRFCREVKQMMDEEGLGAYHFKVQLLAREALNNAVIHGCRNDATKVVETVIEIKDNHLSFEIADPGEGFNWKECMQRGSDDRAASGRGLGIFQSYATEFSYNAEGNRLIIKMNLS